MTTSIHRLTYRPPLDWHGLMRFLGPRAIPGIEIVDDGVYRRAVEVGGDVGAIALRPHAATRVLLETQLPDAIDARPLIRRARRFLDLDADPRRIARDLGRSRRLARLVRARPGLRVPGAWDPFELAVRAILGQQVTVQGATTLAGRLVRTFGHPLAASTVPGVTHLFPRPAKLADADVARIGMPGARARTIRSLAAAVARGDLVLDGTAEPAHVVTTLEALPGIGPWTAEYVAMRALGARDAFPTSDLGIRRALGTRAGLASLHTVTRRAEAWRPWRAYAALHLWMEDSR